MKRQPLTRGAVERVPAASICFYCNQRFGKPVLVRDRIVVLAPAIDHIVPVASGMSEQVAHNLIRCCQMCNAFKGGRVFASIEEIRAHVAMAWARQGVALGWMTPAVPPVPVPAEIGRLQARRLRSTVEAVVDDLKAADRASYEGESIVWRRQVLQAAIMRLTEALGPRHPA